MNSRRSLRNLVAAVMAACALMLTACSSSTGNASVSQSQVENKLKKESEFASAKTSVGTEKFNKLITCIAKTLKKDAKGSDLDAYVKGKKSLDDVQGNKSQGKVDLQACAKSAGIG